jgi:hypothetical protein
MNRAYYSIIFLTFIGVEVVPSDEGATSSKRLLNFVSA